MAKKTLKATHVYVNSGKKYCKISVDFIVDKKSIITTIMYMLEHDAQEINNKSVTKKLYELCYSLGFDFFKEKYIDYDFNEDNLPMAEKLAEKYFPTFYNID